MGLNDTWLTINQTADHAGVSRDTIKRRLKDGAFPTAKRDAGASSAWRIAHTDLLDNGMCPEPAACHFADGVGRMPAVTATTRTDELEVLRAKYDAAKQRLADRNAEIDRLSQVLTALTARVGEVA
jgi:predicted DNA-binding transcriptional regulator AlpA